jgi:DNA mismatch endonuclease (patch repair protein)
MNCRPRVYRLEPAKSSVVVGIFVVFLGNRTISIQDSDREVGGDAGFGHSADSPSRSSGMISIWTALMTDVFSREFRSDIMKRVRREGTTDEELLFLALKRTNLRLRRNVKDLPGKPDLIVEDCRLSIFVDGDFWHGRTWFADRRAPKTNRIFWINRFESNRRRDLRVDRQLRRLGWRVTRVWGSEIRRDADKVARRILRRILLMGVERTR